jgi:hypothetical protein
MISNPERESLLDQKGYFIGEDEDKERDSFFPIP